MKQFLALLYVAITSIMATLALALFSVDKIAGEIHFGFKFAGCMVVLSVIVHFISFIKLIRNG